MGKKVKIEQVMDEVVSLNNQIRGLEMLLSQKKAVVGKYFEATGNRQLQNDEATVFLSERTSIKYDVQKVVKKLGKKAYAFVDRTYTILDWDGFTRLCSAHGISPKELKQFVFVDKVVNQDKLSKLYEKGEVSLDELSGCYDATVNRSVVLKMKNVNRELTIRKS